MPKYLILASYTDEAWRGMIETPPDRPGAAVKLAEALGGSVECFYLAFGEFDLVTIMDLPDEAAAAALSIAVTSTGRVRSVRTHRLLDGSETQAMFEKARSAVGGYEVPGG
jgi:uncharacterized protein with GYD domain